MRAFIALDIDDASRAMLARAAGKLEARAPRGVRFLAPDTLHLTLKFLGAIDDALVPSLSASLAPLAPVAPVSARVLSFDAFPSAKHVRVVVAELDDPAGAAARVVNALDALAEPLGVAREERAYRPHVTLARAKHPLDARGWLPVAAEPESTVRFTSIVLYRSDTLPTGPRYTPLARFAIGV